MQQENGAGSDWTADRVLAAVGLRRFNLPVESPDAWPPDRAGEPFLRQRLLPRSAQPWPHELWEAITAALLRELARAPKNTKLGPWLAVFDGQLRSLVNESRTAEDFRRGLRGLRVSVPNGRPGGPSPLHDMERMLVSQWTRFFEAAWQDNKGQYHEQTFEQFRESVKAKRVFVRFTFGSRVRLAPRAALETIARNGIRSRIKPAFLARKLVARFLDAGSRGVTVKTIKRHTTSSR